MHTHTPSTEGANIAMWNIYEQQVEILKSQLATKFTTPNDYTADYPEIPPTQCLATPS